MGGLKFTGIETGWHWTGSAVDDGRDTVDFFSNACETSEASMHIGM